MRPSCSAAVRSIWTEKRTAAKAPAKRKCSLPVPSKTGDFSTQGGLYSSCFRGYFHGATHAGLVLTDFPFRFCVLEPFCPTEDRCRTGRARIPRMPFYLFLSYRVSLLLPHSKSATLSVAHGGLSPTPAPLSFFWSCPIVELSRFARARRLSFA